MNRGVARALGVGVALTVGSALVFMPRYQVSARHADATLPTLRLNYFDSALGQLAKSLDPALITSANAADTVALVNANLVHILPNNKVVADLASRWTVSKNRKVYTFFIRPNARYSNGHSVKASDFVYSIKRALDPATQSPVATTYMFMIHGANDFAAGKSKALPGLKALNARTLQITIDKPYAFFLKALTYPTADALDPAVMTGKVAAATNNFLTSNCPGNQGAGPFKFECSGDLFSPAGRTKSYTLVPNPYYYGKKPKIKIFIGAWDTLDVAYKGYQNNELDASRIPTAFISTWKKNKQYIESASSRVYYLSPNFHMAPFTNVNCRLALAYSIDRATIVNKVLHGSPHAIYSIVPPGFLGYYKGTDSPHFSVAKAKAALAKCPERNTAVKLTYPTGSSDNDNEYTAIASMMTQAGFNASIKPIAVNDWYTVVSESLDKTQTQLVQNGWQQDYPDPQDYVTLLLQSGSNYDISNFSNAKFDKLVNQADIEGNTKKRAALYVQAQQLAIHQGAWITLTNNVNRQLVKPWVHGLVPTVAYANLVPVNYDWSKVTISAH